MDTGTYLLAAIDPEAEDQLVHLNQSVVSGRMLTEQDTLQRDPQNPNVEFASGKSVPNYRVPLLFHQQLPGQIGLTVRADPRGWPGDRPADALARGGFSYLTQQSTGQPLYSGSAPLVQNDPSRFYNAVLERDNGAWQVQRYQGSLAECCFSIRLPG